MADTYPIPLGQIYDGAKKIDGPMQWPFTPQQVGPGPMEFLVKALLGTPKPQGTPMIPGAQGIQQPMQGTSGK